MIQGEQGVALRHLQMLFDVGTIGGLTDRQLLDQFPSRTQAAGQLGWPLGTLQSRLARGRERLRAQMVRKGLAPSTAVTAALLCAEEARSGVPFALFSTARIGRGSSTPRWRLTRCSSADPRSG